ncbi:caspase, EACC1-associated type [Pantanalinema rosaneae CENA516]|uniref:caspase, EACC1-associated type n=1 Tax=Pantanalinema rosaneae TaxID=1620701 RepID=UPI003D6EFDFB
MAKIALLVGVSEYEDGFNPLPNAVKDIEAMQNVLRQPEMGGFDRVKTLADPDPLLMQQEIEHLFSDRSKDDLVLLFFSGHGIKDDTGRLYFATRITRKTPKGELIRSTAVPASFVHEIMGNSRSKRQIVILDCCFSGAFAEDMTAKDDGSVSVQAQLGGEGRAVLTSSTSTQYSFEQKGCDLSVYTQYLVEGIETGAADIDNDGAIAVDELHDYAKSRVQNIAPAMKPEIYAVREGFRIRLAKAPIRDPKLRYRRQVEQVISDGRILSIDRRLLEHLQRELEISAAEASAIEVEVLQSYWNYQENLEHYKQSFEEALSQENPLGQATQRKLRLCQERWALKPEDVDWIETQAIQQLQQEVALANSTGNLQDSTDPFAPVTVIPSAPIKSTETPTHHRLRPVLIMLVLLIAGFSVWEVMRGAFKLPIFLQPPVASPSATPSTPIPRTAKICIIVVPPEGKTLRVRASPPDGQPVGEVYLGDKVTITGEEQSGYIQIASPVSGWIYKGYTQLCPVDGSIPTPKPEPSQSPIVQSPAPQPTASPTLSKASPLEDIKQYFEWLNAHDIDSAWNQLSESFQQSSVVGSRAEYYRFWADADRVIAQEPILTKQTQETATAEVRFQYFMADGRVCPYHVGLSLVWSGTHNKWLIHDRKHLSREPCQ